MKLLTQESGWQLEIPIVGVRYLSERITGQAGPQWKAGSERSCEPGSWINHDKWQTYKSMGRPKTRCTAVQNDVIGRGCAGCLFLNLQESLPSMEATFHQVAGQVLSGMLQTARPQWLSSRAASTNEPLPPLSASRTKHALAAASAAYQSGALEAQRNLNLWQCVWTSLARLRGWPCKYDRFSCVRSKPSLATMFEWNRRRWWRWHRWSSCPGILTCRKPTNSSSFAAWPLLMFAVCVNFKIFPSIFCIFNRGIKSEMKKRLRQKEPNCFPAGQECCLSTGHFWAAFTCPQPLVAAPDIWGLNWGWLRCKPQGDVHEICLQWGCPLRIATPDDFPDVE